ncbi:LysR family transcriptional regulator [Streptomyces sp. NPDC059740]|uniref:LysR family transcriptional regulator n=1 Tax=Streptomyces sp. NPDC059740 TaxID=3346926 RepID=UPI00364B1FCF
MDYRHEWVASFVAVADHGGFSAAAAALGRSQPRVSAHVAALEKALGLRLFDRGRHPVGLTPEGRTLLGHARSALRQLASLGSLAGEAREGLRGEVRLGVDPDAAPFLLPRLLTRVRDTCPGVHVLPREATASALSRGLAEGTYDLAVYRPEPADGPTGKRARGEELWPTTTVAVLPEGTGTDGPRAHLGTWRAGQGADGIEGTERAEGVGRVPARGADTPAGCAEAFGAALPAALPRPLVVLGDHEEAERTVALLGLGPEVRALGTAQVLTMLSLVRRGWGAGVTDALNLHGADLAGLRIVPLPVHRGPMTLWWPADRAATPSGRAVRRCVRLAAAPATHQARTVLSHRPADTSAPLAG